MTKEGVLAGSQSGDIVYSVPRTLSEYINLSVHACLRTLHVSLFITLFSL